MLSLKDDQCANYITSTAYRMRLEGAFQVEY